MSDHPTTHLTKAYWEWVQVRQALKLECSRVKGHVCYPGRDRLCQECYEAERSKDDRNLG